MIRHFEVKLTAAIKNGTMKDARKAVKYGTGTMSSFINEDHKKITMY